MMASGWHVLTCAEWLERPWTALFDREPSGGYGALKAAVLSHRELFRGISYDSLPSLERLLSIGRGLHEGMTRELPDDIRKRAWEQLDPIHDLCRYHGHIPLLTELAIIADRRFLPVKTEPYFVSFISVFSPDADEVADSYIAARTYRQTPGGGGEPIIPHPELYDPENSLMVVELGDIPSAQLDLETVAQQPRRCEAYRYKFKLIATPQRPVLEQVTRFADRFVSEVSARRHALHTSMLLKGAKLLILPFVRPHYEPATTDGTRPSGDGMNRNHPKASPGGAVFVFLVPQERPSGVDDIARDLAWLLAAGSINESYSSVDVTLRRQQLVGKLIHGTTNAIRSINTAELGQLLCKPGLKLPKTVDDLNITMTTSDEASGRARLSAVAVALRRSMLAEDTAAALLAFAETRYWQGVVRKKFQNGEESDLGELVEEAFLFADNWKNAPGGRYGPIDLSTTITGPDGETGGQWKIPSRYLSAKIIRGILAELMMNASTHGMRDMGMVEVHCKISPSSRGGVNCAFLNEVDRFSAPESPPEMASGFLARTREALAEVDGMALEFEGSLESGLFTGRLWLGPINSVTGGRIEDTELVAPAWMPAGHEE